MAANKKDPLRRMRKAMSAFEFHRSEDEEQIIAAWSFRVIVEADALDGGFVASSPDLRGCWAQGETRDEARENFLAAADVWLEARLADGEEASSPAPHLAYAQ